jgi:prepilin signal peptidase PulO-like enzyme (type II secretory pathway)
MRTMTFDVPSATACIMIVAAIILVLATRRTEWWRRMAVILLSCGFVASAVSTLIGLRGPDAAMLHGASLGFTVSALLVVVLWNVARREKRRGAAEGWNGSRGGG